MTNILLFLFRFLRMLVPKRRLKKKFFIAKTSQLVPVISWPLALTAIFGCVAQMNLRVCQELHFDRSTAMFLYSVHLVFTNYFIILTSSNNICIVLFFQTFLM